MVAVHIALGALALCTIVLAAILFSRGLLFLAGEPRWSVTLVFATMLTVTVPLEICRLFENLVLSAAIFGVLAVLGIAWLWRRPPLVPSIEHETDPPYRWAAALALMALTLVSWAAIKNYLWDEYSGHDPLTNVISRGVSPPEHPLFPGAPFKYHYGFDVISGEVRAFTGISSSHSIDVATIWCFILLLLTSWSVGERLAGRMGASLTMLLAPFGSGTLQYFLLPELGSFEVRWGILPARWLDALPPPVISNFFQHPQGLGMPVSLGVLLLLDGVDRSPRGRVVRAALGALLLGMLSIAHLVFFLVLGVSLGVAVLARAFQTRRLRDAAIELSLLLFALLVAYALGGFLAPSSGAMSADMLRLGRSYFGEPFLTSLAHHLVVFGLPLLLFPLSLLRLGGQAGPMRIALATAVIVGFATPNIVGYERSWDIVKFYGVGGFFASILLADLIASLAIGSPLGAARRAVAITLFVLSTAVGWFWITRMSVLDGALGIPKMHFGPPPPIAEAVRQKLGPLVPPRGRVFSTNIDLGTGAGFLTPGFDWRVMGSSFMLDREHMDLLYGAADRARHDLRKEDLDTLGVGWLVLSPGDVAALSEAGRAALEDPARFEHLFDVEVPGDLRRIYRVKR